MQEVTLITGGSRGIGAATARLLADSGHAIAVGYFRGADAAEALVDEINAAGGRAIAVSGDVARERDVEAMFERTQHSLGTLTGLVNSAGYAEPQARVETMTAERLNRLFATNVTGSFLCAAAAIRRMSTHHGGRGGAIVNVSSAAARLGSPGEYVDYAATKGAVDTLTLGLARETAAEGIRVNAVRPGLIHTQFHATGGDPGRLERLAPGVPMGRGGQAEEVASAIAWLLSPAASYTTGALLDITGGR